MRPPHSERNRPRRRPKPGRAAPKDQSRGVYQSEEAWLDVLLDQIARNERRSRASTAAVASSMGYFRVVWAAATTARCSRTFANGRRKDPSSLSSEWGPGQNAVGGLGNRSGDDAQPVIEIAGIRRRRRIGRAAGVMERRAPVPGHAVSSRLRFPLQQNEVEVRIKHGRRHKYGYATASPATSARPSAVGSAGSIRSRDGVHRWRL